LTRLEAEREARFQAYFKTLNLDNSIEIPCTIVHNKRKHRATKSQNRRADPDFLLAFIFHADLWLS